MGNVDSHSSEPLPPDREITNLVFASNSSDWMKFHNPQVLDFNFLKSCLSSSQAHCLSPQKKRLEREIHPISIHFPGPWIHCQPCYNGDHHRAHHQSPEQKESKHGRFRTKRLDYVLMFMLIFCTCIYMYIYNICICIYICAHTHTCVYIYVYKDIYTILYTYNIYTHRSLS